MQGGGPKWRFRSIFFCLALTTGISTTAQTGSDVKNIKVCQQRYRYQWLHWYVLLPHCPTWVSILPVFKSGTKRVLEAGSNSQRCPSDPVPPSSGRRSYYFPIAPVARVPWERLHHVTDSSVNTDGVRPPRADEWELAAVTPLSRLHHRLLHLPSSLLRLCVSSLWPGLFSNPHIAFTWHPGLGATCEVISNPVHPCQQLTKNQNPLKYHHLYEAKPFFSPSLSVIFSVFFDALY